MDVPSAQHSGPRTWQRDPTAPWPGTGPTDPELRDTGAAAPPHPADGETDRPTMVMRPVPAADCVAGRVGGPGSVRHGQVAQGGGAVSAAGHVPGRVGGPASVQHPHPVQGGGPVSAAGHVPGQAGSPASSHAASPAPPQPAQRRGPMPPAVGSGRPSGHPQPPAQRRQLSAPGLAWVAAHGGAGASSLAEVLGGTDVGCRWPDAVQGEPARVMLVARTHADGMRAASRALDALREGRHPAGMELVALVLVADAPGRLPWSLARRVRVLRSVTPVRRIPWIPSWRVGRRNGSLPTAVLRLGALAATRPDGTGGRR